MTNTTEQKILNALSKSNEPICLSYTKQIKSLGFTRKDFNTKRKSFRDKIN